MSLYNYISVIGGLAFFLFGMTVLSSGLKKVAGDRLESVLKKMTDNPLKGLMFGAVITIAMQSSSALTVMLVGLVNSGIMALAQTVGIIMGSWICLNWICGFDAWDGLDVGFSFAPCRYAGIYKYLNRV